MANTTRKETILEFMRGHNRFVTVEQLQKALYVSGATIRRDLSELENARLIHRTRGGAILLEGSAGDEPIDLRENRNVMQKQVIAAAALPHIQDGMTIFLDSSSTVFALARSLGGFANLTVLTNGIKATALLSDMPNIRVLCTGGSVRENSKSLSGPGAVDFICRHSADFAFISCRGFSVANGASEALEEEFTVKRQYMRNAKRTVLLCDSSKMDRDYLFRLAPLAAFAGVITERRQLNEQLNLQINRPPV